LFKSSKKERTKSDILNTKKQKRRKKKFKKWDERKIRLKKRGKSNLTKM